MRRILSSVCLLTVVLIGAPSAASDLSLFHVVQNGDSLSAIAHTYKTSVKTLQELNNKKGERIVIGSRVQVPWPDTHLASAKDLRATTHEVLPGDSLGTIAERYNSDAKCIRLLNALPNDRIRIGQKLRVPTTGPDFVRDDVKYPVAPGDTLGRIARQSKLTTLVVRHLNPQVNWRQLRTGQTIRLVRWTEMEVKAPTLDLEALEAPTRPEIVPIPAPMDAPINVQETQNPAPSAESIQEPTKSAE
jgi:LysM repeat protein